MPTVPPLQRRPVARRAGCSTAVSRTAPAKEDSHIHRSAAIRSRVAKGVAAVAGEVRRSIGQTIQHRPKSKRLAWRSGEAGLTTSGWPGGTPVPQIFNLGKPAAARSMPPFVVTVTKENATMTHDAAPSDRQPPPPWPRRDDRPDLRRLEERHHERAHVARLRLDAEEQEVTRDDH